MKIVEGKAFFKHSIATTYFLNSMLLFDISFQPKVLIAKKLKVKELMKCRETR